MRHRVPGEYYDKYDHRSKHGALARLYPLGHHLPRYCRHRLLAKLCRPTIAGTYTDAVATMPWHVLSTALWLVLIVSQPALVQSGRLDMHRFFGFLAALVAMGVVFTGVVVQIEVM